MALWTTMGDGVNRLLGGGGTGDKGTAIRVGGGKGGGGVVGAAATGSSSSSAATIRRLPISESSPCKQ